MFFRQVIILLSLGLEVFVLTISVLGLGFFCLIFIDYCSFCLSTLCVVLFVESGIAIIGG